jgi:hypothetical protein
MTKIKFKKMKLAIIGSRDFDNYELLKKEVDIFLIEMDSDLDTIVSGGARGADSLGERYARENRINTLVFLPEWDKYGKKAGFLRNIDIIKNSDAVIAFWDGNSPGTKSSIDLSKNQNKLLKIVYI